MILGVAVALTIAGEDVVGGLAQDTGGIAAVLLLIFSLSIANTTAINLYCGALSCLTFGQTLLPHWLPKARARTVAVVVLSALALGVALLAKDSFIASYTDFILFLLYLLVPWTAINLVDYYLVQHGKYDVAAFLRADGGIYGRVNGPAVTCYVLGFLIQVPFIASPLYTGPVAQLVGGADLSWIVGLAFTSVVYYLWARAVKARGTAAAAGAGAPAGAGA
jgi:NCS1 family nucleobase:cation symporter-1